MLFVSRRGFLAAGAAMAAAFQFNSRAFAQGETALGLSATTRSLDINGRAATVFGLTGPQGSGLVLNPGERFRVDLSNDLPVPTMIHWHGQIPPNAQDGVPDAPMAALSPGEKRSYDFAPQPGTHWMHSHIPIQEMQLLAAPLIVRRPEDVRADRQEVVILLHDFSFKSPDAVMSRCVGSLTIANQGVHGLLRPIRPCQLVAAVPSMRFRNADLISSGSAKYALRSL